MQTEYGKKDISEKAAFVIYVIGTLFLGYLFLKYGLSLIFPFLISYTVAVITVPITRRISKRTGMKRGFWDIVFLLIIISLITTLFILAINRIIFEGQRLLSRLNQNSEEIIAQLKNTLDFFGNITARIPIIGKLVKMEEFANLYSRLEGIIGELIGNVALEVGKVLPAFLGSVAKRFPAFIFFLLVSVISCFYLCLDFDNVNSFIRSLLPKKLRKRIHVYKKKASEVIFGYTKSYIMILILTFAELLVGFLLLGIDYALILSFIISVIDILPVFGVGAVLIPWAIVLLVAGNYKTGVGLLILYGCVTVIRQIAEPKIVGGNIGVHPLATLMSMYVGFKLFGIVGIISGPIIALAVKTVLSVEGGGEQEVVINKK